jgi:carboxypeptidase D
LWQPGTLKPDQNPWSWVNLTNVIWIDQPVGTGFSEGTPTITSETELATQFLGFWKNFSTTFGLQGWKIYIAGESYAGRYVPYIADAMFSSNDTVDYNIQGTMLNDALIAINSLQEEVPAVPFIKYWNNLFQLNDTFMAHIQNVSDSCGYTAYMDEHLVFPAADKFATPKYGNCSYLQAEIQAALELKNPCFDLFQITNACPLMWEVIPPPAYPGYPLYRSQGPGPTFFNTDAVKKAINAPVKTKWEECTNRDVFVGGVDNSPAPNTEVYPRVIEKSVRTVLAHGSLDMILLANGTLLTIQQMTWNGAKGFTKKPSDLFIVPPRAGLNVLNQAGSGIFGITHTERNLTWIQVDLAGHMIPQYAPAAAYRYLEFLLGRIDSLS